MNKDNIFQQMATYDFRNPVTVQTIIEDSDEDNNSVTERRRDINFDNDVITKEKEINPSAEIKSSFFQIDPNKHYLIDSFENYRNKNLDTNSCKTNNKSIKRKPTNKQQSISNQQNCKAKRKKSFNNLDITTNQALVESNSECVVTTPVCNKKSPPINDNVREQDNLLKINIQINEVEKVSSYISDLLTTVSKQLITVIEAYNLYTKVTGDANCDPNRKQEARNTYLYTRDQCFNLSYITVINILIPEENNKLFVNSFIESTVKIGNISNKAVKISNQQVLIFYLELLEWTKKKKNANKVLRHQETNNINTNSDIRYSELRQKLTEPSKTILSNVHSPNTLERRVIVENTSNTCLYSGGPPGKEVSINIRSDILNRQLGQTPVSPTHRRDENNIPMGRNQQKNEANVNTYKYSSGLPIEGKNQEFRENTILYTALPQANSTDNFRELHLSTGIPVQEHSKQQNLQPLIQNFNSQNSQFTMKNSAVPQLLNNNSNQYTVPVSNGELPQYHSQQPLPPPTYKEPSDWQNKYVSSCYNSSCLYQNQHKQAEPQIQLETTRSVSTDSGFISPLNFSAVYDTEQPINTTWQDVNSTPQITHVTSLNPNAAFLCEGSCHVCGKLTKKKCLGCLQYYYCDFNCQKSDWNTHMMVCRSIKQLIN